MTAKSFLFATWEGGGSVAPMLTVARRMVARGHRVRVMSDACNRACAEAIGAEFVPWTRAPSRPDRDPASDPVRDWEHEGPAGLVQVIAKMWMGPALDYARDVMAELRREPADLVVTCEMLFGVALGCEAAGQPFCYLAANVSLFPMPGVPPLGPGLAPARNDAERALHAEIAGGVVALFDSGLPALNAARAELGLSPLAHALDQAEAACGTLLATARAFDFAPDVLPPGVRYVGPQLDQPTWAQPWTDPFEAGDERPLVLAAFSTTFQNHDQVLQRLIDAAAPLPVRLLVTLGGSVPASALRPAANCRLVDSAPHDAVMAQAALVVTHGGHGTVARALTHRLPLLVVPHGRDQNDNAVRVTERGAGLSLPAAATTDDLQAALRRLLGGPSFAKAAAALGEAVARETAESPIVEALEALVPVREACCAA
ncbi:glycosyltransferase [Phenylobacterium sp.]|uniref:glycosyltransferase n=1 Tax=Phenylobacterium sp. TaxID=1871053 RepID=UPI0026002FFC|nr:glycosyltransferase [Phenylobacterium sp.]